MKVTHKERKNINKSKSKARQTLQVDWPSDYENVAKEGRAIRKLLTVLDKNQKSGLSFLERQAIYKDCINAYITTPKQEFDYDPKKVEQLFKVVQITPAKLLAAHKAKGEVGIIEYGDDVILTQAEKIELRRNMISHKLEALHREIEASKMTKAERSYTTTRRNPRVIICKTIRRKVK